MKLLINILVLLLICSPVYGASQLKKTVCPSGCDYTALETCMNANEKDLTGSDEFFDVEISGSWPGPDTTAVTIHNYTTDATHYINVYATGDAKHEGIYDTDYYVLKGSNLASNCMAIIANYVRVSYLQFDRDQYPNSSTARQALGLPIGISGASEVKVFNNIFHTDDNAHGGTGALRGIHTADSDFTLYVYNNMFINWYSATATFYGMSNSAGTITEYVYNNTFIHCDVGADGKGTLQNNIFQDNTTEMANFATKDYNLTDIVSGSSSLSGGNTVFESDLTFNNAAGLDFHLAAGDTDAIGAGENLSGTFTIDIDGTTRSAWDIGADEYVSAVSTSASIFGKGIWGVME